VSTSQIQCGDCPFRPSEDRRSNLKDFANKAITRYQGLRPRRGATTVSSAAGKLHCGQLGIRG